jgi:uncharacterized protein
MTLARKAAPLRLKALADDGVFEGYGSIFNVVDSVGDVVAPGAYAATLARHASEGTRPKGLWQHDPSRPILTWLDLREDDRGLWCKGRLILEVEQAREAHALMKAGELDGLSIGFECTEVEFARPEDYEQKFGYGLAPMPYAMPAGSQVRVLKAVDLWEVSIVTFPACAPARVEAVKAAPPRDLSRVVAAIARRQAALAACL